MRGTQADEEGCKGGLAATGGAFEEDAVARADLQVATPENRLAPLMVAEAEIVRLEDRLSIGGLAPMRAERERRRLAIRRPPGGPPRGRRGRPAARQSLRP